MENTLRKYFIAGNWKMNKSTTDAEDLIKSIVSEIGKQIDVTVAVCPPFTSLDTVSRIVENTNVLLGAQNMYPEINGAFTGEISPDMLRSLFCTYVILGHSERRAYFNETDEFINLKVRSALENNIKPILCVGETIEERDAGNTMNIVERHVVKGLAGVSNDFAENLVIAYEPVWAIGTGKTATPEMAQEVHHQIRRLLSNQFGEAIAAKIRILYGGSMKPANASELLDQPDIDGGLIGGAALESISFNKLVEIAIQKSA